MARAFIPYGIYWSTPFARWQGSIAHLNSLRLAANTGKQVLDAKRFPMDRVDLGILGHTNPQPGSFYGLPWVTAMMGLDRVAGPSVQQACATSARMLQMAVDEVAGGSAQCALLIAADRCSNAPIVYYPDPTGPGGSGISERWLLDAMALDPHAKIAMIDTAENVAARFSVSTAEQHDVALARYAQYQQALLDDRAFQRRYMVTVPITDASFRRETGQLPGDEGVIARTAEGLAKLKTVRPNGTVTSGSQTHPADGNAGMIVTTREIAREVSIDPKIVVELLGFGQARVDKGYMPMAVAPASLAALKNAGLTIKDVDAVKTHNPFAVNDIAFARETGFPLEKMNNFGCSLIWGHPQGPTGLRSVIELIEELVLRGGGIGVFGGCAAGDSAMALVLRVAG